MARRTQKTRATHSQMLRNAVHCQGPKRGTIGEASDVTEPHIDQSDDEAATVPGF